jgi:tricorn protease
MRAALLLLLLAALASADEALWLRYPAISPDGSAIAFSYKGDLWLASADGGEARPLTSHVAYEFAPVWSPDGKTIAFASDRHGNFDVFVVPASGGVARRLTAHSGNDIPTSFTRDGKRVLFSASRYEAPEALRAAWFFPELYSVSVEGGRPRLELTTPALDAQPSPDGSTIAYTDLKGFESPWRKHHTSSVARDVWLVRDGKYRRLTDFKGEDRDPVWSADGKTIFYLSEASGSFNVWSRPADGSGAPEQVTRHADHPVRFLSAASDGTLCYAYGGRIWTKRPGKEPRDLRITVSVGERTNPVDAEVLRDGATEFAVSPDEEEIAFVARGEVFVTSTDHGTTKRITRTPEQERDVQWSPDGKTLYYAGERDGSWNIYAATLARPDEGRFFRSTLVKEAPLLHTADEEFQPLPSPDGKSVAYLRNRDEIAVLDLASGQSRTLVPAARNYSYEDGDIRFDWSPDSSWLACSISQEGGWIGDIAVVEVATGKITDMTVSGYEEWSPQWSADGSALVFASNRFGRRDHGSWDSEADVLALDLTEEAHDRWHLSDEEYERWKESRKKEKEKAKKAGKKGARGEEGADEGEGSEGKEKPPPEPTKIEFEGCEDRTRRLTVQSTGLGAFALSPDGEKIAYFSETEGKWDVWLADVREGSTRKLLKAGDDDPGDLRFGKDGKAVFVRRRKGAIVKVPLDGGPKPVPYAAEMTIDGPGERAYVFDHCWRLVKEKFYDEKLHGVDWDGLRQYYAQFLPHIESNYDFAELVSELAGELNASHTGARYRNHEGGDETAALGILFSDEQLTVAEVLRCGPAAEADSKIRPGDVLIAIDGTTLGPDVEHFALLNHKASKPVRLGFRRPDGTEYEQVLRPISPREERELLYKRWVDRCRARVDRLSHGRLGYAHMRGMNDDAFREVFKETLGRDGAKEGLVLDTRFNGGGNNHDDLVMFLSGRPYLMLRPRGKEPGTFGSDPEGRWARPTVVVQSEGNYSDAHIFPYVFRKLGVGKLVGAPVAGTGTAVWWERQIDPTLIFGVPQVGFVTDDGHYLENTELEPDVLVLDDPEAEARGEDPQLDKAVEVLLAELK